MDHLWKKVKGWIVEAGCHRFTLRGTLEGTGAKLGSSMPIRFEADGEMLGQTAGIEIEVIPDAFLFAAGGLNYRGDELIF